MERAPARRGRADGELRRAGENAGGAASEGSRRGTSALRRGGKNGAGGRAGARDPALRAAPVALSADAARRGGARRGRRAENEAGAALEPVIKASGIQDPRGI